jgi:hypothetical protein
MHHVLKLHQSCKRMQLQHSTTSSRLAGAMQKEQGTLPSDITCKRWHMHSTAPANQSAGTHNAAVP